MTDRKSSNEYWESEWEKFDACDEISLDKRDTKNTLNIVIHQILTRIFENNKFVRGSEFFEVGCGGSRWLPYFSREFGFSVSGLDYTDSGVASALAVCARQNVQAKIVKGDYERMDELLSNQRFDVVGSFGFVEHFEDTARCLGFISQIVRPGGLIVTIIPNMAGITGWIYKLLKPSVYEIHNPLNLSQLVAAHVDNELEVVFAEYLLATPGVIGKTRETDAGLLRWGKNSFGSISRLLWRFELLGWHLPRSKFLSPYIICVAKKH